jgi:hypothetical protein
VDSSGEELKFLKVMFGERNAMVITKNHGMDKKGSTCQKIKLFP